MDKWREDNRRKLELTLTMQKSLSIYIQNIKTSILTVAEKFITKNYSTDCMERKKSW